MRICQLIKLSITIFLVSCAAQKVEDKHDDRLITAHWLNIPLKFALRDKEDNFLTHPFFDVDPAFKKEKRTINFFVTTPEESEFKYNINLYSGRLYKEHDYCPTDDIWDFYKGELNKPNFTEGIVPRTYDQNSIPQKIIVFGSKEVMEKFKYHPTNYDTAKIVGSVLLEACENYPCDLKSKWKATQILLAVNARDLGYSNVNLMHELKSKVDWTYVKSMLVNKDGVHQLGKKYYPAFRISKELNLDETLKYFEANSVKTKMDELQKWRAGCFKMYDDFWEKAEKIRSEKIGQQDKFLNLFKDFYTLGSDQFYACQKLVRPGNINENSRRLWFFTYIQAFANLAKNNFYFSCSEKSWAYNPKVDSERFFNDQNKELQRCRARDFEKTFDQAINGLSLMKSQTNKSFRFVEYDTQRGGSHQKIYAWIADEGKTQACKNKKDVVKEKLFDIFPQDVVWQNFNSDSNVDKYVE